jgi:hypothetical protein
MPEFGLEFDFDVKPELTAELILQPILKAVPSLDLISHPTTGGVRPRVTTRHLWTSRPDLVGSAQPRTVPLSELALNGLVAFSGGTCDLSPIGHAGQESAGQ